MDKLSEKAKEVVSSIGKMLVFANESHSYGDCDNEGPTEIFHTLYLIVEEEDTTFTQLKFYREVFYIHGDSDASVDYQSEEVYHEDQQIFDAVLENTHSNDDYYDEAEFDYKDTVYNTKPSDLSKPAKVTLAEVQTGLEATDTIFFIGEDETFGECDNDGPLEYFFTLYIFVKKLNGNIVHYKFSREFHWRHDKEKDAVPYEETGMGTNDFKDKHFHL
jgi:hypothetical protein